MSIDIETSGLDPDRHSITQFAAVIDDLKNPYPIEHLPKFNFYVSDPDRVWQKETINFGKSKTIAKEIHKNGNNVIPKENLIEVFYEFLLENGFTRYEGCVYITAAGKNFSGFDHQFIERLPGYGQKVKIIRRCIDPAVLYLNPEIDDKVPDMNTCLVRAGIEKIVSHDALEDCIDVVKLVRYMFVD